MIILQINFAMLQMTTMVHDGNDDDEEEEEEEKRKHRGSRHIMSPPLGMGKWPKCRFKTCLVSKLVMPKCSG